MVHFFMKFHYYVIWGWYLPFWEVFDQISIGKEQIFSPKFYKGKSLTVGPLLCGRLSQLENTHKICFNAPDN